MFEPETVWEFNMVDHVKFGSHAATELPANLDRFGADRVLVVTDSGIVDAGIIDELTEPLASEIDVAVFADVEPDPAIDVFEAALALARDVDPDVIVGVGGGSSMDVAKTTGTLYEQSGDILEYVAPPTGDGRSVPDTSLPVVAIPTTAGTGSETSPVAVISLPDKDLKVGISSRHLYPELAIVDPSLTVSLPPGSTAASGMDALSHAIEAYTTRRYDRKARPTDPNERPDYNGRSMLTDQFARTAIELIADNLRRAVNNGSDLEARRNMSLASFMAGVAFTNAGLGATHAMAYPVASEHHTPHGVTIATLLPAVMEFNSPGAFDRYTEIGRLLGEDISERSDDDAAKTAAQGVEKLASDVGIPGSLGDLGVTEDEISVLAEKTMDIQRLLAGNPRRIDQEDVEGIFRASL